MKRKKLYFFILLIILSATGKTYATHIAGGELVYTWLHDSTYEVTFKLYRDCSGVAQPNTVGLCYHSSCATTNYTKTLALASTINNGETNGTTVSSGCPGYPTTCNGGTLPGYREWWYQVQVTLPYRCAKWVFAVSISARNPDDNLYTAAGPGNGFYVEATLNNVIAQGNSSAEYTVKPVPYVCDDQPYSYNNGAYDINNDSLGYEVIDPEMSTGCNVAPTNIPFSSSIYNLTNNPIYTNNTFVLDTITGQLNFTPAQIGNYTLTLRVTEYRNGVAISTTMRDIQVHVISCNISSPAVAPDTTTIQLVNGQIHDCGGYPLHFCFSAHSADTSAVLVPADNSATVAPGSTMTYTGAYTAHIYGCFSWSPTTSDTGIRILTVTVTDSSCAPPGITEANTFTLPLYIFPVAHSNTDTVFCLGSKMTLTANGVSGYTWSVLPGGSPVSSLSCVSCQHPVDSPTTTTTYIASSISANGCPSNDTVLVVTVAPPSAPSATGTNLLCLHDTLKLYAGVTAPSYRWTGPSGFVDTTQDPLLVNFLQADTGRYYVVAKNAYCTSPEDSIYISIYPPTYALNADTSICQGGSVILYGRGNTYFWSVLPGGAPAGSISCDTCATTTVLPTVTTSYVISSVQTGCNTHDTVAVTVVDYPAAPVLNTNAPVCVNDTLRLFAGTTALSYSWTGPHGYTDTLQDPLIPNAQVAADTGTYYLTVRNGQCGDTTAHIYALVVQPPPIPVIVTNSPLCVGSTLNMVPKSNEAQNYYWTGPNGFVITAQTVRITDVTTQYSGLYTVTTSYPADAACFSPVDSFDVVIVPKVYASFQFATDSICQGYPVAVSYSTPGADSIAWSFDSGTPQNISADPLNVAFATAGEQTVTLHASNIACADSAEHQIFVMTTPPATFTATPTVCPGDPVYVNSLHDFAQDVTFTWNFGQAQVVSGANSGLYTLLYPAPGTYVISLITQNTYCTSYPSYDTVVAEPYPDALITSTDIGNICSEDTVHFTAVNVAGYHYQWRPLVLFSNDTLYETYAPIRNSGYIYLDVKDQYGCTASDSLYIEPHPCCNLYFPNAFTPNGDGRNDIFKPITIGHHDVAYFRVFDRWGQLVFSSGDEEKGWNGTVGGIPADIGTYFYAIRYMCVTGEYFEEKGEVILVR